MAIKLRPYRVKDLITSDFFQGDPKLNENFCIEDLLKSGLEPDDMLASAPSNLALPKYALAGYLIPYWDIQGKVITAQGNNLNIMYRKRYKLPQFSKDPKYLQPSKEELAEHGLPGIVPYLLPYPKEFDNGTIYCVEGEKKTAAVIKHCKVAAFGIAGCQMWRNPNGNGGIHPWILDYLSLRGAKKIRIIPDADVLRYDMCQTYGTFADVLKRAGYEVELLRPTDKIDDLIHALLTKNGEVDSGLLTSIETLNGDGLVQTASSLAIAYNLAFKSVKDGPPIPYQHTSNIMKLMASHSAFPKLWRNLDTNRVMLGDNTATPDLTEMDIANHFQHNFGFDKVNHRVIYSCIQALSKRNERSPMLEYISSQKWDQVSRLDSWLSQFWGVESSDYIKEVATKWLVSACARMDKPGSKVDWMMIVVGPQGTGKTSMPGIMFKGNSLTMYGDQNDKDLHMLLHSALVVGFDELDSFGKRENSNLKAMITRQEDAFRPPYGASVEIFARRFTLYGCGNRHEFLQHDPSGYRRYAVVEVEKLLDFDGLSGALDQLWAEAWWRYRNAGLKWWEIEGASKEAEKYVTPNVLEEEIEEWVQRQISSKYSQSTEDGYFKFTMNQLMKGIEATNGMKNPNTTREIAAILKSKGWFQKTVRVGVTTQRMYHVAIPP